MTDFQFQNFFIFFFFIFDPGSVLDPSYTCFVSKKPENIRKKKLLLLEGVQIVLVKELNLTIVVVRLATHLKKLVMKL